MRTGMIVGGLALVLAGCSGSEETPVGTSERPIASAAVPTPGPPATTIEAAPNVGTPSERPDEVEDAIRLMREEFDLPAEEIRVIRVEDVVWPGSALGCPAGDDATVTQGPVPGYRIILGHEAVELHYHGADGASPRRCDFVDF